MFAALEVHCRLEERLGYGKMTQDVDSYARYSVLNIASSCHQHLHCHCVHSNPEINE